jgi:hypothetical protein
MTATVITPFSRSSAIELGNRLWRKKLLPVGQVDYKGRKLQFTADYLKGLARAVTERAYDQVPFQLAGDSNAHTNDPERFAGEIIDADVDDTGLYIVVKPTERGQKVLTENPALGVSARIVEDYARSDGKFFSAALQHVLGTLDPRIPSLGPWQAVDASNSAQLVIDLSSYQFDGQETDLLDGLDPTKEERTALEETLDEILAEEGALENWAENGDPVIDSMLNAMIANPDDYYRPPYAEDLSSLSAALEFSNQQSRTDGMVARHLGRMAAARGDWEECFARYCESPVTGSGSAVDMANQPGQDAFPIELSRYEGEIPALCGRPDSFGRCAERYHAASCSHVAESATSTSTQGVAAFNAVLSRRSRMPHADADGRIWRRHDGGLATLTDHVEAMSGVRRRTEGLFEAGPRTKDNPGKPELVSIQPQGPGFLRSTQATARRLAAQARLTTSADHARQRRAWRDEHARREAAAGPQSRRLNHPDYRWGPLQREREERQAQASRQPLQFSMTDETGEDLLGPLNGSLGPGIGAW